MNNETMKHLLAIRSLTVFGSLKADPVIGGLGELLEKLVIYGSMGSSSDKGNVSDTTDIVALYSRVMSTLYPVTSDLGDYIRRAVLSDDNFYVEAVASGESIGDEIQAQVKRELIALQEIAEIRSDDIIENIGIEDSAVTLPRWTNGSLNLLRDFMDKLNNLGTTGYGMFADHSFFRIEGNDIVPVPYPDVQPLAELFGYERQRQMVIKNTEALLAGEEHASNMLLYGDAGTGKSSTVKAVAFAYAQKGLRLIEIKKEQLSLIPMVLDRISRQPLKFILFIDDLSFSSSDDNFSALKATLEGSITGRGNNAVIYATSNRRHLIRESVTDRDGDEIHVNDMLQETMSLAARFGLTVMFGNPDKDEYLEIVSSLAELYGIDLPEEELFRKAEAHAIRRNGRSPRTAKQFMELLKTDLIQ